MIKLTEELWIGNSGDERAKYLGELGINAILNVAQDLQATRGVGYVDYQVEYWQVGLLDGPGNPPSAYHAAILSLDGLLKRRRVLMCCHTGSRALAVAVMWFQLKNPRSWGLWLESLREQVEETLPEVNEAHQVAFTRIDWKALARCAVGDG